MNEHSYLLVLRASLEGVRVHCWHEITSNEQETKNVLFGMTIASNINMGSGVLKVMADEVWTAELMEIYLRHMSQDKLKKFIEESKV
ncbi:hypothetical protein [Acinetobacter sp.]|uniref:hypothetical protein n=1 Tax=Acinetobacter sp. TaxID=472 RepID=UPI00388D5C43